MFTTNTSAGSRLHIIWTSHQEYKGYRIHIGRRPPKFRRMPTTIIYESAEPTCNKSADICSPLSCFIRTNRHDYKHISNISADSANTIQPISARRPVKIISCLNTHNMCRPTACPQQHMYRPASCNINAKWTCRPSKAMYVPVCRA